ncbi:hypothetical protein Cgig2_016589 [Carnegiea gigantea]|uniref:Serine carboxypeptidase n=1 Tax=Carnegiea gigantea TaxID=171969 RepID=A0A9Q1QQX1_9CARY|nr:hypothetical protein Cgig2_016589 [Carnegiea gigantea]
MAMDDAYVYSFRSICTPNLHLNLKHFLPVFCLSILILSLSSFAATIVESIPGYPGDLPFRLETGYIGVGDEEQIQLFYYYIESERDPKTDPLVLWLTGGPGASGLSDLVLEIGPLDFDYPASWQTGETKFKLNPYSWTKVASVIFIDAPVGAGFSYATIPEGYYTDDITATRHTYEFLRKVRKWHYLICIMQKFFPFIKEHFPATTSYHITPLLKKGKIKIRLVRSVINTLPYCLVSVDVYRTGQETVQVIVRYCTC